jgi:riboflavin synthase
MFTGLIQETGRVVAMVHPGNARATRISIAAKSIPSQLKTGDSVAVSGVCLTAIDAGRGRFSADLSAETLARTSLGSLQPGSVVNLELPAKAGDRLGGHIVQGHVDGVGKLLRLEKIKGREDWRLTISLPPALRKYVVPQGSITIEGISLTVAGVRAGEIEIAIIPHTYIATNLHRLRAGGTVNVETDVLSKYAGRVARRKTSSKPTVAGLIKKGF